MHMYVGRQAPTYFEWLDIASVWWLYDELWLCDEDAGKDSWPDKEGVLERDEPRDNAAVDGWGGTGGGLACVCQEKDITSLEH